MLSPKTDSDVAREIFEFEKRFRKLIVQVQIDWIKDDTSQTPHRLLDLQTFLTYLPASIRSDHYEFIQESLSTIKKAKDIEELFLYLNLYWSFIDCNLLQHLIGTFGSEGLQVQMDSYVADLVRFRKSTTVAQFAKHWPKFGCKKDPPPHFSELRAKLPNDPSSCTLEYVEKLRIDFCREFFLSRSALVLAGIIPGSVIVVWYVPSSITPRLDSDLSKYEGKLFQVYGMTELHLSPFSTSFVALRRERKTRSGRTSNLMSRHMTKLQMVAHSASPACALAHQQMATQMRSSLQITQSTPEKQLDESASLNSSQDHLSGGSSAKIQSHQQMPTQTPSSTMVLDLGGGLACDSTSLIEESVLPECTNEPSSNLLIEESALCTYPTSIEESASTTPSSTMVLAIDLQDFGAMVLPDIPSLAFQHSSEKCEIVTGMPRKFPKVLYNVH